MKCDEYRILIEDYVDGALDQRGAARLNAHTAECAECANFYQEMSREQELYSRYQRDVEVTPVLWASIESRIKQEQAAQPAGLISRLREQLAGVFSAPRLSPAFAAALVIVAIGVTIFVMSRLNAPERWTVQLGDNKNAPADATSAPGGGIATPAPQPPRATPQSNLATNEGSNEAKPNPPKVNNPPRNEVATALTPAQLVREAEQKYLTAIAMLSRDVNRRRSQLDPMMLARFDASLSEIDRTIRETRQVVKGNPEDPIALQYLLAAYSKKVDVLREMTND